LLDNAESTEQVAPLLEWRAPTTLLIVTSRPAITVPGLARLSLDVMDIDEPCDLISAALAGRSVNSIDLSVLAERCGRLPLALRVAGTFLALNRVWSVGEYIEALADERNRRECRRIEENARLDVHAVLGFSARRLAEKKPQLFEHWTNADSRV
jgi:hypothetical protein